MNREDIPDNVETRIADFNQPWPFEDHSVDLVHMRQLQYGVNACSHHLLSLRCC
jgi:hypothetical protein